MQNPTSLPKIVRAHVFISGRVQGVGYRYATVNTDPVGFNWLGAESP